MSDDKTLGAFVIEVLWLVALWIAATFVYKVARVAWSAFRNAWKTDTA